MRCNTLTSSGKIKGDLFREYLRNLQFPGVSQDVVAFDANYDLKSGGYAIVNLQPNTVNDSDTSIDHKEVGYWSNGKLSLKHDQLQQSCKRLRLEVLNWTHPLAIILWIVSLLGAVIIVAFMVVFVTFRKTRVIKATSRELSAVVLGGIFLCYLLPLIYIGTPHAVSCAFRRYGIGVCLSLCFGAIFVKQSRIHRIFNRNQPTTKLPHFIDWKSQLVFTAVIVVLCLLIGVAHMVHVTSTLHKFDKFRGNPLWIPVN